MQLSSDNPKWQCSLIIPAYNESKNILKCLNFIVDSISLNVEVLIINDGSTDDTELLILDFIKANKAENIHYFKQENKGAASARLFGIEKASTEYIAFLDCDDSLNKSSIHNAMSKFFENDEIDFVLFDYYSVSESNIHQPFSYSVNTWPITGLEAFSNTIEYWGIHAFGIYRRSTILAGYELYAEIKKHDHGINNVNDDELIARCAMLSCRLVTLSSGQYFYSSNDNSTTRRLNKNLFKMAYTTMSLRDLIASRDTLFFLKPALNLYILRVSTNLSIKHYKWRKELSNNEYWVSAISMLINAVNVKDLFSYLTRKPLLLTWSMFKYLYIWIVYAWR